MKLIVGLGNPGKKYEKTRHNCGFLVADLLSDVSRIDLEREDFKAIYGKGKIYDEDVIIAKPQTFMNLSGECVVELVNFFKINLEDVIIIYDDMALLPGNIRLRENGSSGGQKGMQNIIDLLGTSEIKRIRIGIGEPVYDSIDYVLGVPEGEDATNIESAIKKAKDAILYALKSNWHNAMSKFN